MSYNVSIYGGSGFVGRALADALIETSSHPHLVQPHRVTIIDNLEVEPAAPWPSKGNYTFAQANVKSSKGEAGWNKAFGHFAENNHTIVWLPAVQGYARGIDEFGLSNVYPTFNLFEAIRHYGAERRINRIVLASSQAVYAPGVGLTEASPVTPISIYGSSKLIQEKAMFDLARLYDIPVYAMRYSVILGAGQSYDSFESGVMRNWVRSFKEDKGPEVYGDGLQLRDFVHIDDVTSANVKAVTSTSEENDIFNIGGYSCSVIDLAYIFQDVSGSREPRVLGECPREDGGVHNFVSSGRHAYDVLGYEPRSGLSAQVADAFQHFNHYPDSSKHIKV